MTLGRHTTSAGRSTDEKTAAVRVPTPVRALRQEEPTAMLEVHEILGRLDRVKQVGNGWTAPCPAHDDDHPSLSIDTASDGKVLLYCHAGCSFWDILKAIGINYTDGPRRLTPEDADTLLRNRGLRTETIQHFRIEADVTKQAWKIPLGQNGAIKYKAFEPAPGKPKSRFPKGTKTGLYTLEACRGKDEVWLVEGEPDVWIMHQSGLPAFSFTGGAGTIPKAAVGQIPKAGVKTVNIVYDNDDAGREGARKVAQALREAGVHAVIRILPNDVGPGGDITTLYNNLDRDDDAFREALGHLPVEPLEPEDPGDDETVGDGGDGSAQRRAQAQILVQLADEAELFHTPEGEAFATVPVGEHRETHAVQRKSFRQWLVRRFYEDQRRPPAAQALTNALGVLEARASFDGPERQVFTRVAEFEGAIYLDLGTESWEAIKITEHGWVRASEPPVRFRRTAGMRPLPMPVLGGSVEELRRFVNIETEADFLLIVAFLIATLRPKGPYPVLILLGEQGSAKTTTGRVIRSLVDPSTAPTRTAPREERDLMIAATNAWILAYDNISKIPPWLSDALCRLATGGAFSTRQLYTDTDEVILEARRPVMLNGITDMADRDDLRDRAIMLTLPSIPDSERRDEETFWQEFEAAGPQILGALLDAVSAALRDIQDTTLDEKPRMADFARWVTAAAPGLGWDPCAFLDAYTGNREGAIDTFLEEDRVANEVRVLVEERGDWKGTASELLEELDGSAGEKVRKARDWPNGPRALSGQLRQAAPALRRVGIHVSFSREKSGKRRRLVTIGKCPSRTVSTVSTVPDDLQPPADNGCAPAETRRSGDGMSRRSPATGVPSPPTEGIREAEREVQII
jgi:hypothetical protein